MSNASALMPRYAARKDNSHDSIADGLREDGWSVMELHRAGNGIPDLCVGKPGFACFVECKSTAKDPLTPAEKRVKDNWDGPYIIAVSLDDARRQLSELMK